MTEHQSFDSDLGRVEQIRNAPQNENSAFLLGFIDNLWKAYMIEVERNESHERFVDFLVREDWPSREHAWSSFQLSKLVETPK